MLQCLAHARTIDDLVSARLDATIWLATAKVTDLHGNTMDTTLAATTHVVPHSGAETKVEDSCRNSTRNLYQKWLIFQNAVLRNWCFLVLTFCTNFLYKRIPMVLSLTLPDQKCQNIPKCRQIRAREATHWYIRIYTSKEISFLVVSRFQSF